MNLLKAFTFIALGLAIAATGIYVANADDALPSAVDRSPRKRGDIGSIVHVAP